MRLVLSALSLIVSLACASATVIDPSSGEPIAKCRAWGQARCVACLEQSGGSICVAAGGEGLSEEGSEVASGFWPTLEGALRFIIPGI